MSEIDELADAVAQLGVGLASAENTIATLEQEVASQQGDTLDKARVASLTQTLRDDLSRLSTSVASAQQATSTGAATGTGPGDTTGTTGTPVDPSAGPATSPPPDSAVDPASGTVDPGAAPGLGVDPGATGTSAP